ncbi:MAG: DUF2497 domain-containing protein [Erythrobacter sp.]|nr:DUF2497 domain-containing protein [Erythrobacter sp.]
MAHQNEASVEEILESIKKVIARDNRTDAQQALARGVEPVSTTESASSDASEEVLELADMLVEDDKDSDLDGAGDTMGKKGNDEGDEYRPLLGEEAQGAMKENLAALAMLAEPGAKPQIVRSGETSLEGLTRELLRPMLAEWLDKNLPGMVEKMVQAEIARIAGKRR